VCRPLPLVLAALATGCGALRSPSLDPKVHVRGEHYRVIHEPVDRLWPQVLRGLEEEGLRVTRAERAQHTIQTAGRRYTSRDEIRKLGDVADLSAARGAGLGRATEYVVAYALFLLPAGETDTSLKITSTIEAIDRSETVFLGAGVFDVIPHRIEVPSRGVVERDLLRRLAGSLFTAEEMLFVLGEPGFD